MVAWQIATNCSTKMQRDVTITLYAPEKKKKGWESESECVFELRSSK